MNKKNNYTLLVILIAIGLIIGATYYFFDGDMLSFYFFRTAVGAE